MPVSWNAFMDQRLLVAVLAAVKLDTALVVTKWQELFGREEIEQPTQRAIVKHISKLKKTLGISGNKSSMSTNGITKEPRSPKTPKSKKQKLVSTPLTPPESSGHDEDKQDGFKKDIPEPPMQTPTKKPTNARRPKAKSASKRRRDDTSDEEEGSMTEADDAEDDDLVIELPAAKTEEDDFTAPGADSNNARTWAPTRSQRPRRAKAERKPIVINDETSDEEKERDVVEAEEAVQDEMKQDEAAMEEALIMSSPPLPHGDDCLVVAAQKAK